MSHKPNCDYFRNESKCNCGFILPQQTPQNMRGKIQREIEIAFDNGKQYYKGLHVAEGATANAYACIDRLLALFEQEMMEWYEKGYRNGKEDGYDDGPKDQSALQPSSPEQEVTPQNIDWEINVRSQVALIRENAVGVSNGTQIDFSKALENGMVNIVRHKKKEWQEGAVRRRDEEWKLATLTILKNQAQEQSDQLRIVNLILSTLSQRETNH